MMPRTTLPQRLNGDYNKAGKRGMPVSAVDVQPVPDSWQSEECIRNTGHIEMGDSTSQNAWRAPDDQAVAGGPDYTAVASATPGITAVLDIRFAELTDLMNDQLTRLSQQVAAQAELISGLLEMLRLKDRKKLTVVEAARHANVEGATVRRWLADGKLKGVKTGGAKQSRWRINVRDLDRFLEQVHFSK